MGSDIRIYAQGASFAEGVYDLRSLEVLVSSYRSIMDRLVAVREVWDTHFPLRLHPNTGVCIVAWLLSFRG